MLKDVSLTPAKSLTMVEGGHAETLRHFSAQTGLPEHTGEGVMIVIQFGNFASDESDKSGPDMQQSQTERDTHLAFSSF